MNTQNTAVLDPIDNNLGYKRSRTRFQIGKALELDASYRLAHLPLVNLRHPDCIKSMLGKDYDMGRHGRVHSLVLPIPQSLLETSTTFLALEKEIKASTFAHKIAWDIVDRRRESLHATICGALGEGEAPPILQPVKISNPMRVVLRGLFSGNVNVGRLYLMAYPEKYSDINVFQEIQKQLGRPQTDLYLVGLYNLIDHLTVVETADLSALIERWWDVELLTFDSGSLWLTSSRDDLVLDSRVEQVVQLISNNRG